MMRCVMCWMEDNNGCSVNNVEYKDTSRQTGSVDIIPEGKVYTLMSIVYGKLGLKMSTLDSLYRFDGNRIHQLSAHYPTRNILMKHY